MGSKFESFLKEIITVKEEKNVLQVKVMKQESRIKYLEREIKRKNLIVTGVVNIVKENEQKTRDKIMKLLQKIEVPINVQLDRNEVCRIGKYKIDKRGPVSIKLEQK